jgi:biotin-(acetyl-CoA carboxylase) ligase
VVDAETACASLLGAMQLGWQRTIEQSDCQFASVDALVGKHIAAVNHQGEVIHGVAKGINALGYLGMQTDSALQWLHSGEVSIKI